MGKPVAGTATVVLGDVVGSTKLWEADAAAMTAASRRLHEIADQLAEKHRGHRPREQGEGDNLVAAFGVAADAVAFAMELDAALAVEEWPGGLELLMRLGINTGDVTWDDDAGYLGPTFNRCARIRDLGHARQVLASAATASVVGDKLPAGVRAEDLGEHRLRDLERAEHVWQLRHADDDRDHPPLRSLSNVPNNLPTPVTSLVGRGKEITETADLLREHRLITLTGAGGSGKTRLAQHIAAEAAKDYPDGAWWVDLMPVADEARVPVAIAEAVRVREVAGPESIDQLVAGLADRRLLLVIDNCEHVIDLVAEILDLIIMRCPHVTMLATSRETISIEGEHAIRVRPLGSPEDGATADELQRHDATRLFIERARAVGPFEPTDADAPSIAAICRRLDGIPLAIELAAARTKLLSVKDIETALDDRFRLLTSGARRSASRQRTLEASVAWSHDLLSEEEQAVFARLGVFPGPFDLDSAASVGGLGDSITALDVLTSLVDKSLVTVQPDDQGRRYRMLETIRQYALDRLTERGEVETARDAHLDHMLAVGASLDIQGRVSEAQTMTQTAALFDDLRNAVAWAIERDRPGDAVDLHFPHYVFYLITGRWADAKEAIDALIDDDRLTDLQRVRARQMAMGIAASAGDPQRGADLAPESIAAAREFGDPFLLWGTLASALSALVWVSTDVRVGREAWQMVKDGQLGPGPIMLTGCFFGAHLVLAVQEDEAEPVLDTAIEASRQIGIPFFEVYALTFRAGIDERRGGFERVPEFLRQAREVAERSTRRLFGIIEPTTGIYEFLPSGNHAAARERIEAALAHAGAPGSGTYNAAMVGLANVLWAANDLDGSAAAAGEAVTLLRKGSTNWYLAIALGWHALGEYHHGNPDRVRAILDEQHAIMPTYGWLWPRSLGSWAEALLLIDEGNPAAATLAAAMRVAEHLVAGLESLGTWPSLEVLAVAVEADGRPDVSARVLGCIMGWAESDGWSLDGHLPLTTWRDALTSRLRDTLGNDGWKRAVAAGRTLSPSQLLDEEFAEVVAQARAERDAFLGGELSGAPAATARTAVTGWEALTEAELDVARKVAEGLSNPDVAEALFVSRNTVKTHLSSVYAKLGVSNRTELATSAAAHGLLDG